MNCLDVFNWTGSYRDDSDIQHPYGWFDPINKPFILPPKWSVYDDLYKTTPFNKEEFIRTLPQRPESFRNMAKKSKHAVWAVSHCYTESKREQYVEELRKHIRVSNP